MPIYLLEDTIKVEIYFDVNDCTFDDNICVSILEECPQDEKIFRVEQSNLYLTPSQARQLAKCLLAAANKSEENCK